MNAPYDIVFIGLTLSSSWGNGHATTYRSLLRGLHGLGLKVLFLERDVPWYAQNRDLAAPGFCDLAYYRSVGELDRRWGDVLGAAGTVIVGSYVPDGIEVIAQARACTAGRFCFYDIDTPVTLAALERGDATYLAGDQIPLFDIYFSFSGGPILRRLERDFGARSALPLYCSVDAERYRPIDEPPRWDLGYLGTYSADRQPTLERLLIAAARELPHKRFVVAGPQYPQDVAWPDNIERLAHLPPAAHPAFYSRQRFTLNVTRSDMIAAGWSPSVRLFEAAACGTAIISDRWDGLQDLLPNAVTIADTSEDVVSLLGRGEGFAAGQAEEARKIILRAHTGQARARELVAALDAIPGRRPAAGQRQFA